VTASTLRSGKLSQAARAEVLEKARVPSDALDQAVEFIRQIGWDNVL
jgi:hypothetical protein